MNRAVEAGIESPEWGAVTVVQRFGSALQLMPHFHTVAFDGVFSDLEGVDGAHPHRLPAPTDQDLEQVGSRRPTRMAPHTWS
jgi:hypothetical protein